MFFKNWKTRKQLLKEIEELKADKYKYSFWWEEKCAKYRELYYSIEEITATCISNPGLNEEELSSGVKECLCTQLAKEIMPYVSFEKYVYAPIDPHFYGEAKYTATIKIVKR